jgi:hypothetical protein
MSEPTTDERIVTAKLDDDGVVEAANPAFVELVGPDEAEVVGRPIADRLAPESRSTGASLAGGRWCGRRVDGLPWVADVALWPDPSGGCVLSGVRCFGRVEWAEDLSDLPSFPSRAGLDSVVSHDIRGAARSASGFVSVVQRTLGETAGPRPEPRVERAGEHLAIVARSLAAVDDLAEHVVRATRWAEQPLALRASSFDALLTSAVDRSHDGFDGERADVRSVDDLPAVVIDGELVEWALAELLTNARKFHRLPGVPPTGGLVPVEIGAASSAERAACGIPDTDDGYVIVAVRDCGIGISPSLAEDAFAPGRKLQPRGDYPGVGMGLALVRLVFERHAGWCRIAIDEHAAPGVTVVFRLPVSPSGVPVHENDRL